MDAPSVRGLRSLVLKNEGVGLSDTNEELALGHLYFLHNHPNCRHVHRSLCSSSRFRCCSTRVSLTTKHNGSLSLYESNRCIEIEEPSPAPRLLLEHIQPPHRVQHDSQSVGGSEYWESLKTAFLYPRHKCTRTQGAC